MVYYIALFFYWKEESTIFKRVHKRIFHWVVVKKGLFVPKVGLNFLLCIQKFYGCPSWCWATSISMPFSLQGLCLRNFKLLFDYTQILFPFFFIWLKWLSEQKQDREFQILSCICFISVWSSISDIVVWWYYVTVIVVSREKTWAWLVVAVWW